MTIRFDDRVAIITGAGSGLGASYAFFLASRGAKVLVNDLGCAGDGTGRSLVRGQEVVAAINSRGGRAAFNGDDVAEPAGAGRIVEDALRHFGTVDILINNAGILRDRTFAKMPPEDFETVLQVHFMGSIHVTRSAFPIMQGKNYGRIILTTSAAGLFGNFGQTNYGAAKMALIGFMNSLKLEAEKHGIMVNAVAPLAVTPLAVAARIFPERLHARLRPDLVTPLVAYLSSERCRTSGDIISAGGGRFAKVQVVEGPGIRFQSPEEISPETIALRYAEITRMEGAVPFPSAKDEVMVVVAPMLDA